MELEFKIPTIFQMILCSSEDPHSTAEFARENSSEPIDEMYTTDDAVMIVFPDRFIEIPWGGYLAVDVQGRLIAIPEHLIEAAAVAGEYGRPM